MTLAIVDADGVRTLADADTAVTGLLATDDLLLHRVALQSATAAERLEEARMRAIDLAAQPLDELHIAVGPARDDGSSWVAIIAAERLRAHLADLAAAGLDPAPLWPAALALDSGACAQLGGQLLFHGARVAGLAEPELLAALGADDAPTAAAATEFVPGAIAEGAPDLRQGPFAPRIRWWRSRRMQLAAGLLVLLIALLLALPPWVEGRRTQAAIAAMGADIQTLARAAGVPPAATPAATAARLQAARAAREGAALGARLSFLTAATAAVPGAHVERVALGPDNGLAVRLGGSAAAINQLAARLQAGPFATRSHGADATIGGRRAAAPAAAADARLAAMLQLANATRDAGILQRIPPPAGAAPDAAATIAAAGLEATISGADGHQQLVIAAARANVLLPLIARLEQQGARFAGLAITRNSDDTLRAQLDLSP